MNATKYDGYNPNTLGPNALGLYDMLHKGWIDRAEFNRRIARAEYEDELYKNESQYERENRHI